MWFITFYKSILFSRDHFNQAYIIDVNLGSAGIPSRSVEAEGLELLPLVGTALGAEVFERHLHRVPAVLFRSCGGEEHLAVVAAVHAVLEGYPGRVESAVLIADVEAELAVGGDVHVGRKLESEHALP